MYITQTTPEYHPLSPFDPQMMPDADDMVRELHVRTVQFVHKKLSAAKAESEEAKGALEEQIRRLRRQISRQISTGPDEEEEENLPTIELVDQEEVRGETVNFV